MSVGASVARPSSLRPTIATAVYALADRYPKVAIALKRDQCQGVIVFDGTGGATTRVTVSVNGGAFPGTGTATYTVNSDCTATILLSRGETLFGAIVNAGRELRFMNATPGYLGAAGVAKKIAADD